MTDTIEAPEVAPTTKRAATKAPPLPTSIFAIIPKIREDLGAISKDEETLVGTKYKYRGHDQIINAIVPLLNKYGVFTTVEDELLRYEGRAAANSKWNTAAVIRKKVTFWAPDGSSVTSTVVAESTDNGNKAVGQAQTYAERFAYTQTFTIPTGDADPDSNAEDAPGAPEPGTTQATATQPTRPAPAATGDAEVESLKADITTLFKGRGVTDKDEIRKRGNKFFNGRENWTTQAVPLRKLKAALEAGEAVGE